MMNVFINIENNRVKVGELAISNKKIYFQYDNDFLSKNINISPITLPFNNQIYTNNFDLHGVFKDSIADGWGRLLINRYFKKNNIKNVNELDYLSFVGDNGFGALEYEPANNILENNINNIELDKLANESIEILNNSNYFVDDLLKLNGSSCGARPKITVKLNNKNIISKKGTDYIIKFRSNMDDYDIGLKEYVYSIIAKKSNIEMSKTVLLPSKNCVGYFATQRFDRIDNNKKLHLHSVAGLLNIDFRTTFIDYIDLLKLTKLITKDFNEVIKMYRLMCFNVIIENKDDHSKNFSFLMDSKGNWKLSPAYDLTKSNGINGEHTTTINGKGKDISNNDLINIGSMFDIDEEHCKDIINLITENSNSFDKIARNII